MLTPWPALIAAVLTGVAPQGGETLSELLARAKEVERQVNRGTEGALGDLSQVLQRFHEHAPALAADPEALQARALMQLSLARRLLLAGDTEGARETIDEIVRSTRNAELSVESFGPELARMYQERRAALARDGTATIEVTCASDCRIYIDERRASARTADLLLGTYRVWVESTADPNATPLRTSVELDTAGEVEELDYPEKTATAAPSSGEPLAAEDEPRSRRARTGRLLPRWVEILGLGLGAAATAVGGILLYMDGQCTTEECDDIYATSTGGIIAAAFGGTLVITSSVLLGVDETRVKRRKTTARTFTVGWRWRF